MSVTFTQNTKSSILVYMHSIHSSPFLGGSNTPILETTFPPSAPPSQQFGCVETPRLGEQCQELQTAALYKRTDNTAQTYWQHCTNVLTTSHKPTDNTAQTYWQHFTNVLTTLHKRTDNTAQTYWQHRTNVLTTLHKRTDNTAQTYWQHTPVYLQNTRTNHFIFSTRYELDGPGI
jgi:hypothetical protein